MDSELRLIYSQVKADVQTIIQTLLLNQSVKTFGP